MSKLITFTINTSTTHEVTAFVSNDEDVSSEITALKTAYEDGQLTVDHNLFASSSCTSINVSEPTNG